MLASAPILVPAHGRSLGQIDSGGLDRVPGSVFREDALDHETRATSHETFVLPSVPVYALLDDHAVEFEECKRWANSEAGQAARITNPAGFANVRSHADAHLRAMSS